MWTPSWLLSTETIGQAESPDIFLVFQSKCNVMIIWFKKNLPNQQRKVFKPFSCAVVSMCTQELNINFFLINCDYNS